MGSLGTHAGGVKTIATHKPDFTDDERYFDKLNQKTKTKSMRFQSLMLSNYKVIQVLLWAEDL